MEEVKIVNFTAAQLHKNNEMLTKLSIFFSTHYGKWGKHGPHPGEQVTMGKSLMKRLLLFDEQSCGVVVAFIKKEIVGQMFYYSFKTAKLACVGWITQLVTHCAFRQRGIASRVIKNYLSTSDFSALGLISSHPYAIRALEKACGCQVDRGQIEENFSELISSTKVPYVNSNMVLTKDGTIDTQFFVDHDEVLKIIENEKQLDRWNFGTLQEGHEYFAFVFFKKDL